MKSLRVIARRTVGRSYVVAKRVELTRMARRAGPPLVVFSMGKTGSTAVARAIADATGEYVFQVFRLRGADLPAAERRYRDARRHRSDRAPVAFPGALHLWEAEFVAQAVSAFFHAGRGRAAFDGATVASLNEDFDAEDWIRRPARWFDREFAPALGIDAYASPFDTVAGLGMIETPAVRVLLIRQEDLGRVSETLGRFLGLGRPVPVPARNEASSQAYGAIYREFVRGIRLPVAVLDRAYGSRYARHFYTPVEIGRYRQAWGGAGPTPP